MSEWNWRDEWRETTEGGTHVVAVFRDPDGTLVVVAKTTMGLHRTWNATSEGHPESGSRSYDLVPVVKEPEWEPWSFCEVELNWWYREKGSKFWAMITGCDSDSVRINGGFESMETLFEQFECTPHPFSGTVQRCGKLKVQP